jgi:hypothetical protein
MMSRAFFPAWLAASLLVVVSIAAIASGHALIALALGVAVPLLLWIAERPQRGLLLLVALAPFDGLRIIVPEVSVAWKFVLLGGTLLATFVCPPSARGRPIAAGSGRVPTLVVPVAGFVLLGLLSAAAVGGTQALVGIKLDFLYALAGVAVWRCPFDRRDRDRFVTILMATGFVCAVVGLAQQLIGPAQLNAWGYPYNETIRLKPGGWLRSFSTFDQPFPFALFLSFVIVVGVAVALQDTRRLRNHIFLMLLPVYGAALLFSFVRSAFVALFVGSLYLAFRGRRIIFAVLPLLLAGFLVVGSGVHESVTSGSSLEERTSGWQANVHNVIDHPLGAGIGSTGSAAEKLVELERATTSYQPDNYYFKTVYELGLLGLWLLVLVLGAAFTTASNLGRRLSGVDAAFCDGLAAGLLGAAAASFFATYLEIFPLDLLFWITLGLLARIAADVADGPGDEPELAHDPRRTDLQVGDG